MNYNYLKEKIFGVLNFSYDGEIEFTEHEGMYAARKNGKAVIGADCKSSVCRALTEFAKAVTDGKDEFEIFKKMHFKWCGPMLDVSRNATLTVDTIKEMLDLNAALGNNMMMLYFEDIFEMDKYPYFGYKRGRYTIEEMREIDDYAYSLGIEMIPCIETLGHLERYLGWAEAAPFRDTEFNIMPGTKESLKFVEEMIAVMRKAFRSKHIHVGMDEAFDVGRGKYFDKHRGEIIDQHKLLFDHLAKVNELCVKYGYEPIIWSDLFFPDYDSPEIYTYNSKLPKGFEDKLPKETRLMYWYYSSVNKKRYLALLEKHKATGNPVGFAGGAWCWEGYAPNTKFAMDTNIPALEACIEENPEMALITTWGEAAFETSFFLCMPSFALYAEYCWNGKDANPENAWAFNEFVTKTPKSVYDAMDALSYGLYANVAVGRRLFQQDVFETVGVKTVLPQDNMPEEIFVGDEPMKTMREAADYLEKYVNENGDWRGYFAIEVLALRATANKAELHARLFDAYKSNNKQELNRIAEVIIPQTTAYYMEFYKLFQEIWLRECKAFGWEIHCARKGFQLERLEYAADTLRKYLSGELEKIEELEVAQLNQKLTVCDTTMFD